MNFTEDDYFAVSESTSLLQMMNLTTNWPLIDLIAAKKLDEELKQHWDNFHRWKRPLLLLLLLLCRNNKKALKIAQEFEINHMLPFRNKGLVEQYVCESMKMPINPQVVTLQTFCAFHLLGEHGGSDILQKVTGVDKSDIIAVLEGNEELLLPRARIHIALMGGSLMVDMLNPLYLNLTSMASKLSGQELHIQEYVETNILQALAYGVPPDYVCQEILQTLGQQTFHHGCDRYKTDRGLMIAISNEKFDSSKAPHELKSFANQLADRPGTKQDAKGLCDLMRDTYGVDVYLAENLHHMEMRQLLEKTRDYLNQQRDKYDYLMVALMSHGANDLKGRDIIYGSDCVPVMVQDVVDIFGQGLVCSAMIGKPKIFIVQACRTVTAKSDIGDSDKSGFSLGIDQNILRNLSDCLYINSTIPGENSLRHCKQGSFFIQNLIEVLKENRGLTDMLHLATTVSKRTLESVAQQVEIKYTLTKKLFLTARSLSVVKPAYREMKSTKYIQKASSSISKNSTNTVTAKQFKTGSNETNFYNGCLLLTIILVGLFFAFSIQYLYESQVYRRDI